MTVIARRFIATPARSASEAWSLSVELLVPESESQARKELLGIAGIASALIADEAMKTAPIVVSGSGPRVRIYCLYDEEAIVGEQAKETSLPAIPTAGNWQMSLPCPADDLPWVQEALKKRSMHVSARDLATGFEIDEPEGDENRSSVVVDTEVFFRS